MNEIAAGFGEMGDGEKDEETKKLSVPPPLEKRWSLHSNLIERPPSLQLLWPWSA